MPTRLEDLLTLPGVARKTANVVAAELGHAQGIVVDTHVRRLSQRLGLTRDDDPVKIERDLVRIVPRADWHRFPHLLIWHGRRVCDARRPRCEDCVLADLCPSSRVDAAQPSCASQRWPGWTSCSASASHAPPAPRLSSGSTATKSASSLSRVCFAL